MTLARQGSLWLIRPRLEDGEIFSSWLHRLAQSNGMADHTFCNLLWPGRPVWNRDVDRLADMEMILTLSEWTGVDPMRIYASTLPALAGRLTSFVNQRGNSNWILPTGVYHRVRRRFGYQFCPLCLAESPRYIRTNWRLSWSTVCSRHAMRLLDRCGWCSAPMMFHRMRVLHPTQLRCATCDGNVLSCRAEPASQSEVEIQVQLEHALASGTAQVMGQEVPCLEVFSSLRQLLRVAQSARIRAFADIFPCVDLSSIADERELRSYDFCSTRARNLYLWLAWALLADWPDRMEKALHVLRSPVCWMVIESSEQLPAWFWNVFYERSVAVSSRGGYPVIAPSPPIPKLIRARSSRSAVAETMASPLPGE